ncbi:hypothetical protein CesoFtcFv8_016703 [Champsocephalus esox]|uniref:Uncharacterized protein n=1 Tax=Champsocephalus esox TaxID=159716 RepID=A0AAN8BNV4_9TELE|nr:hypothetical protein CesoFtcFv8_016703 [Champsocephalus esox]
MMASTARHAARRACSSSCPPIHTEQHVAGAKTGKYRCLRPSHAHWGLNRRQQTHSSAAEAAVRHTSIRAEHRCSSSMMNRGEDRLVSELSAEQRDRAAVLQLVKETPYHLQEASPTVNTGRKTD